MKAHTTWVSASIRKTGYTRRKGAKTFLNLCPFFFLRDSGNPVGEPLDLRRFSSPYLADRINKIGLQWQSPSTEITSPVMSVKGLMIFGKSECLGGNYDSAVVVQEAFRPVEWLNTKGCSQNATSRRPDEIAYIRGGIRRW